MSTDLAEIMDVTTEWNFIQTKSTPSTTKTRSIPTTSPTKITKTTVSTNTNTKTVTPVENTETSTIPAETSETFTSPAETSESITFPIETSIDNVTNNPANTKPPTTLLINSPTTYSRSSSFKTITTRSTLTMKSITTSETIR